MSKQNEVSALLADRAGLEAYLTAGKAIEAACKPLVDAIKANVAKATDAKNAADAGKTEKAGIWAKTLEVVGIIAEATKDAKTGKWREQLFTDVMGEFMEVKEGEKPSTAKAYASTGRAVLVKLLPRMTLDDVKAKSYADVRKLVSPPKNAEADGIAKRIGEQVRYILRNADKHGGSEKAVARLDAIAAEVATHYNAVKTAKDAKASASKAAKELEANRQQRAAEGSTVETVKRDDDAKPEAPKLVANG